MLLLLLQAYVCTKCGSLVSTSLEKPASSLAAASVEATLNWYCSVCTEGNDTGTVTDTVRPISVPYVFRYLLAELAAMNIKIVLDVKNAGKGR